MYLFFFYNLFPVTIGLRNDEVGRNKNIFLYVSDQKEKLECTS